MWSGRGGVLIALAMLAPGAQASDFERDIWPVLESRCIRCHGDGKAKAGLRLDSRAAALAGSAFGETPVIVAGDARGSELWRRIASDDEFERMPARGDALEPQVVEAFREWIEAGAVWPDELAGEGTLVEKHWSFVAPKPPVLPGLPPELEAWARGPLDRFVAARLAREGLSPAPEADRPALIRRASLDLLGLPPTPQEARAFEADDDPLAYEHMIDRLLASPHYGEHQARHWLDLARYADSQGYEKDDRRTMWRWRDWVIDAFNRDLPFDRFTIEQLAGDLLPEPTTEQLIATGFHRNTMVNREGGTDPEEFRVAAVVDRVDTTASVWLGATIGCARCHDHKFDPFKQREYYELFAFFNQTADNGNADEPVIEAPTPALTAARTRILGEISALEEIVARQTPELDAEFEAWEASYAAQRIEWQRLRPVSTVAEGGSRLAVLDDDSVLALDPLPPEDAYVVRTPAPSTPGAIRAVRLEVLADDSLPERGPGRPPHANFVLNELTLHTGAGQAVALAAAFADFSQVGEPSWPVRGIVDGDPDTGWAIGGGTGRGHVAIVTLAQPLELTGKELVFRLEQNHGGGHLIGRFRLSTTADEFEPLDELVPPAIETLVRLGSERNDDQRVEILDWFRQRAPSLAAERERLAQLRAELPSIPTALVMQTVAEPRETHLLVRGSFLDPGERVEPGVPAVLHDLPDLPDLPGGAGPATRLDLARWLVSPDNPLTARVTVNRAWGRIFGQGLVATESDFGTQADAPSHPDLLDWLATEFQRTWSLKQLQRTILTSATYRQSSNLSATLRERDPANRLLARGPRVRVGAETVRDLALAASGLLTPEVGGPSVFPPQPEGIWAMTYSGDSWEEARDEQRYRRGLYTFWRRTAPYPAYLIFDAPSRELTCTRRIRTNTPLQALATLNDPAFVECALALARLMLEPDELDERERASLGFQRCVTRTPTPAEVDVLLGLLASERETFARDPARAQALIQSAAGARPDPGGDPGEPAELAAWTVVANVLLNLDEMLTKG